MKAKLSRRDSPLAVSVLCDYDMEGYSRDLVCGVFKATLFCSTTGIGGHVGETENDHA